MIHFAYPNVKVIHPAEFIGCGRYIASEQKPEGYDHPSKIMDNEITEKAAEILAYESFQTKKNIYEKKDRPDFAYMGESKNLAYLLALISRSRKIRLKTDTDIWCTGSIKVNNEPSLNAVKTGGFDIKLRQGFLSEENQDTLFIVPENNFLSAHQEVCDQKNVRVLSVEQFGELSPDYRFEEKTVLKVGSDELFRLTSLVFEMAQNPYKGLEAFEEEDAARFFGRDEVIQELFDTYQNLSKSPMRLMAILGPSGSGKSSIARAGFIPKIRPDSSIILFRPGDHPLETLNKKLSETPEAAKSVIIADQFEEIYSMCEDKQERTEFVRKLLEYAASDKHRHISVIIVFRADFLGHAQSHPELSHAIAKNTIIVPAMSRDNLRSAIADPARRAGYVFDIKIVDELISQTDGHDGALPLLEFALSAIWQGMEKGVRPEKTLKDINGVGGALAKKAQELYNSLKDDQDKRIAKRIFLSLRNFGEGSAFDARRRILLSEIIGKDDYEHVIRILKNFSSPAARIITLSSGSDKNNLSEDKKKETTVEITHEALFEHWNLLKKWIDIHGEDTLFHRRLSEAAKNWEANGKAEGLLWRSPDLDRLQKFYDDMPLDMTPLQIEFYLESKNFKEREEKEKEAIRKRELEQAQALAEEQLKRADEQAEAARKLRALLAKNYHFNALYSERDGDRLRAIHYFARSEKESFDTDSLFVRDKNFDSHNVMNISCLLWKIEDVKGKVFSKDKTRILTWGNDGWTAYLWNAETGEAIGKPMKHEQHSVDQAKFSEDGSRILTWGYPRRLEASMFVAQLWNAETGEAIGSLRPDDDRWTFSDYEAIFSKDDSRILTWIEDGARLWDAKTGKAIGKPMKHDGDVASAIFSKDASRILTVIRCGHAQLWNTENNEAIGKPMHEKAVGGAVFSKDDSRILTWSEDGTARLWDAKTGRAIRKPMNHEKAVREAVFSKDDNRILTWSEDGTVRLWDAKTGRAIGKPMNHGKEVKNAIFSKDESRILTWSDDGTAHLWNAETIEAIGKPIKHGVIRGALFFKDDNRIFIQGEDIASLWNTETSEAIGQPMKNISGAIFSKDESQILTWSKYGTVHLWNAKTGVAIWQQPIKYGSDINIY